MAKHYLLIWQIFLIATSVFCDNDPTSKIDPALKALLQSGKASNVFVVGDNSKGNSKESRKVKETLSEISELVASTNTREGKTGDILTNLVDTVISDLGDWFAPVISLLTQWGLKFELYWIANTLLIRGINWNQVVQIADINIVIRILLPGVIPVPNPMPPEESPPRPPPTGNTTYNIGLIDARCPNITCLGNGIIVSNIDTGVLWNHIELRDSWRGTDYGWLYGPNPLKGPYPFDPDEDGHGTHTLGAIVGKNVGVAPGATWIACGTFDTDVGGLTIEAILTCGQFLACPYLWNDTTTEKVTKNCSLRAHVIYNSYGVYAFQMYPSTIPEYHMIQNWNRLGIISTWSVGNTGPVCSTGAFPGTFPNAFAVGAVNAQAALVYFSSRGPAMQAEPFPEDSLSSGSKSCSVPAPSTSCLSADLENKPICTVIKPDIVAPGLNINSSFNSGPDQYIVYGGTSMAAPHIAGVAALMLCARKDIIWNQTLAYNILTKTVENSLIDLQGNTPSTSIVSANSFNKASYLFCNYLMEGICDEYPNNLYGWGLVWACRAVQYTKDLVIPK